MKACPICRGPGKEHHRIRDQWLVRCGHCGFVFAGASDEEIDRVNSQYGESTERHYDEIQTGLDYLWFDRISARLTQGRRELKVLDIGCGNGVLLRQFQKHGCICFGSDPSPWARTCAERYGYALIGCIEEADVARGSFDIITSTSTLEHIARPLEHVRRIMEILKPGGTAYFTIPNYGSLPIRLRIVQGRLVAPPSHCNYFTARTLKDLFCQKGLGEHVAELRVRSYGIPEIHGVYQWLSKRRGRTTRGAAHQTCQRLRRKKILAGVYYWSGSPFGLGDKLEAVVRKNVESEGAA